MNNIKMRINDIKIMYRHNIKQKLEEDLITILKMEKETTPVDINELQYRITIKKYIENELKNIKNEEILEYKYNNVR